MIERWKEAFDMKLNDKNEWEWNDFVKGYDEGWDNYFALVAEWNKFIVDYNAVVAPRRRNFGRPLAASDAQRVDVLKRRKAGQSLRSIVEDTNLSLRTVRTIVGKADYVGRARLARLQRIAPDRVTEDYRRAGRKIRNTLPQQINVLESHGQDLLKRAKGTR
jgi:hypothetical protein